MLRVAVVGSGWAGAAAARALHDVGYGVDVYESSPTVGGHSRAELLNGVVYEPNGAHIFHTSNEGVAVFVRRFGLDRPYAHCVLTQVDIGQDESDEKLLSWPPQVEELRALPAWPSIDRELQALPTSPSGASFAEYATSLMGPTLYRMFLEGYTTKQWGRSPSELSSSFAPRRIELRRDGYRRLFRDRWEFFSPHGAQSIVERILAPIRVTCGVHVTASDLAGR